MASAKNNQLIIRNNLILVHAVQLKPTIKVQISGRMASIGISDNYYYYYFLMNKSQETTVFHSARN